jgi:hypothetical protein
MIKDKPTFLALFGLPLVRPLQAYAEHKEKIIEQSDRSVLYLTTPPHREIWLEFFTNISFYDTEIWIHIICLHSFGMDMDSKTRLVTVVWKHFWLLLLG